MPKTNMLFYVIADSVATERIKELETLSNAHQRPYHQNVCSVATTNKNGKNQRTKRKK